VAADTFRAAATEQLEIWSHRLQVDIVKGRMGADPSSVVFDALTAAKARESDIVLIDTAGRLQNKTELMQELEKIRRTCHKVIPNAPHQTLVIIDATTGQNGIEQAVAFHKATPLTGVFLSKVDGSAKGGIALSICKILQIPIQWLGTGEKETDLASFDPETYIEAIF